MPEGPTIRNTAERLREVLVGRRILSFSSRFKKSRLEGWPEKVVGQIVTAVRVHGKNLFIDLDNGWTLYSHMLMWGSWHIYGRDEPWLKEERKARAVIETDAHCVVLFSAPVCQLIHQSALAQHQTSELGPDLLDERFEQGGRQEVLRRLKAQRETPIGEAIMNQTVMAGIGNILKSEILFKVGVHPLRPAGALEEQELEALLDASRGFMLRAYETGGFSQVFLPPGLRQVLGKLGYVYGRSGQLCLQCGGTIKMIRQGRLQRMTFFCPHCQPLDPANPVSQERAAPPEAWAGRVSSLAQAREFVLEHGLCGVLPSAKGRLPALWDALDDQTLFAGRGRWAERMAQVLAWRDALPREFPGEIVATRLKGGQLVLLSIPRLRELYRQQHKPVEACSPLAQTLYQLVAQAPIGTWALRRAGGLGARNDRARFDRALQELQTTLNVIRSPESHDEDVWVPFSI